MELEVLITTMHQRDMDIVQRMNIQTDAVIANQADEFSYQEKKTDGHKACMMTTPTRGLSRNRNIAMALSTAEYILFVDDDLVFNDGYADKIKKEFEQHPEADAIKFNIHDLSEIRKISMSRIEKYEKATRKNMSASGVCGVVVKRKVLVQHNLHFHENFGAGSENYCGEDTIFIMEMLDNKVRLYRSPVDIAGIDQGKSSWFQGYNEKYFTIAGKVLGTIYPHLSYLIAIRSAYRFTKRDRCKLKFWQILKCYYRGIKNSGR